MYAFFLVNGVGIGSDEMTINISIRAKVKTACTLVLQSFLIIQARRFIMLNKKYKSISFECHKGPRNIIAG